ncbi:bifunctional aminoglycoside phosphotransferase/ATP-binding protein [Microcoleus sp. FACHB-68]|uniref:bifunctional aminoglycoside phosphotransferase/ATP-binding protein n=1 Tax=Microcoleus sp. FACHB-68 TaxID=2692826 RepID=UPI0016840C41|nr:bifunctional aminoglycoside phosphotransferase/ATP-binding protein [Microcoleus sp. FACHB-68]MBD1938721.1 AAA family ATPase [Microcoleus sp. FACHB-68]
MRDACVPVLIQQMLQPAFYCHWVREPVELIQTHSSFVLLTGNYVYKIKKPVNFGLLDYSTLAKRRFFCERELLLNQRGAPDVYLEVLPVTQLGSQFQLGGVGEPVEYALKMRQVPQEALFVNLLQRGLLTEQHLEELGRCVANFHEKSLTNEWVRSFGNLSQIREAIEQNYQRTEKYIEWLLSQEQFADIRRFTDNFFTQNQALFDNRIEKNWIRECHGDLHLSNIAWCQDKVLLFDCIEFNDRLRCVDVMFDLAYAVVDLEVRQRPDLSNIYLNTYIEQTGDWEGLQVLPLYLIRQAYVRAMVTSFLLDDPSVSSEEKEMPAETAKKYYNLAWQYTQPRQGEIILMSGLSGSGKSTVARHLARQTGAIHIRSDAVRKHLGGISLNQRGGENLYTPEMTHKTYHRLLELGVILAQQGWRVILDGKYDRQAFRLNVMLQCNTHQLPLQIVYCTAPAEVLRDRLNQRKGDIADATADLLPAQQATAEPFTELEQSYVKIIDTTEDLEEQLIKLRVLND